MNLYPHDCSYLNTEYGRRKAQECYEIEMMKRLDDGEQEGNEYVKTQEANSLFSAQDTKSGLKR
jgi:hypothetical protein